MFISGRDPISKVLASTTLLSSHRQCRGVPCCSGFSPATGIRMPPNFSHSSVCGVVLPFFYTQCGIACLSHFFLVSRLLILSPKVPGIVSPFFCCVTLFLFPFSMVSFFSLSIWCSGPLTLWSHLLSDGSDVGILSLPLFMYPFFA